MKARLQRAAGAGMPDPPPKLVDRQRREEKEDGVHRRPVADHGPREDVQDAVEEDEGRAAGSAAAPCAAAIEHEGQE